jgi:hypothetical protein
MLHPPLFVAVFGSGMDKSQDPGSGMEVHNGLLCFVLYCSVCLSPGEQVIKASPYDQVQIK